VCEKPNSRGVKERRSESHLNKVPALELGAAAS
jgi:hypothetical protein